MKESTRPKRGKYWSKADWDAVDWSKPQKQIAREMGVQIPAVSRQMRFRGMCANRGRLSEAMGLLKEVDASNRKSAAAMAAAGREIPPGLAGLIDRISKFLEPKR